MPKASAARLNARLTGLFNLRDTHPSDAFSVARKSARVA
jgi:hypothetical protein